MGEILDLQQLPGVRAELRRRGMTVVLTNGCFDLLHVGHVRYLREARRQGDVLIVGVNGDESVRRLKGEGRPLLPERERAEVVAALASVDYVAIFPEDTAEHLVDCLHPDVYVKGSDYLPGAKPLPEARLVAAYGGRIVFVPLTTNRSTSAIIASVLDRFSANAPPARDGADSQR